MHLAVADISIVPLFADRITSAQGLGGALRIRGPLAEKPTRWPCIASIEQGAAPLLRRERSTRRKPNQAGRFGDRLASDWVLSTYTEIY